MGFGDVKHWLGIDLGTSSAKVVAAREDGSVVYRGKDSYSHGHGSSADVQDARDFLRSIKGALREYVGPRFDGVAVVGQTPSLVAVDDRGEPVFPVMGWRDTSAANFTGELERRLGPSELTTGVGQLWDGSHLPAKVWRLGREEKELVSRVRWFLQPKDYAVLHLTGIAVTDAWSSKGLWSVSEERPMHEVFALAGLETGLLPPVLAPWTRAGEVQHEAAIPGVLEEGTPVAVGWTDALAGILAIGAATEERSFILSGTSDIVGTSKSSKGPRESQGVYHVPRGVSPLEIWYGPTQSSGASLEWLCKVTSQSAGDLVDLALRAHATEASFSPYLQGERAPIWNDQVRAAFWNLDAEDGLAEIALAVLRGVAFSGRHVLEAAGAIAVGQIHLGGENVQQAGWIRARQEAMGCELVIHQESQMTALGACMLARTAAENCDIRETVARLEGDSHVLPMPAERALPDTHYSEYLEVSAAGETRRTRV